MVLPTKACSILHFSQSTPTKKVEGQKENANSNTSSGASVHCFLFSFSILHLPFENSDLIIHKHHTMRTIWKVTTILVKITILIIFQATM